MQVVLNFKIGSRDPFPLPVVGALVQPVETVRDLGVHIDSDLGASTHVRRTVSHCFAVLASPAATSASICY